MAKNTFHVTGTFMCRDENDKLVHTEAKFELRLDFPGIAKFLGGKALQNKSKISHEAGGLVEVEVIRGLPKGQRLVHQY